MAQALISLLQTCTLPRIVSFCWELVSKRGGSWILHYVKSAYAVTDVPDQVSFFFCVRYDNVATQHLKSKVPELVSQHRRWLNSSFFAAVHSTFHFHYYTDQVMGSAGKHGFMSSSFIKFSI